MQRRMACGIYRHWASQEMLWLRGERLAQAFISLLPLVSQSWSPSFLVLHIYACIFFAVANTPRTRAIGYFPKAVSKSINKGS
jgi:hypothetical protein